MVTVWAYTLISVLIISLISLIGIATLSIAANLMKKMLLVLVAFAAGALIGDVFLHLLPELVEQQGFSLTISLSIIGGMLTFFILEKFIHWHHCHHAGPGAHAHPFAIINLVGDALHNFIDGIIIAVSFLVSIPVGIATTVAVMFHEIPQEIGDFAVLLHGGFSKSKALLYNFLTALAAIVGAVFALSIDSVSANAQQFFVPFTVGAFIYIATADLIPELHKEESLKKSAVQLVAFIGGIAVMGALLLFQ